MANNKALPFTGSGDTSATVATDEIAGVDYQVVKLADGTEDATTRIAAGGGVEAGALRVTVASDSTGVLSVDDNGASLTVDNAHLTSLGGAVSGTEVQVDVVGALPAGTNAIGKLAANSGVDIGDVDVTSVVPGTGATNLGKAEDAAHTTGDVGVMGLAVRTDTPANRSGTDGDYEPLQMSAGRLWTSATIDTALPAGTNAIGKLAANSGVDIGDVDVTSVVPGTGASNLGKAEDAAHSTGDVGVMSLAVRKDTAAALAGTDGDYAPLEVDADGKLHVNPGTVTVTNAHLTSLGGAISGTEVQVDVVGALPAGTNAIGKLAANSGVDIGDVDVASVVPGTGATNLGKAEDAAHTSGDVGVMALSVRQDTAAALSGTDADYQPLITDASGRLHVTASGGVGGTVAHDSADSGNPVKVGGKARTTNPTAVADADRVDATFDDIGRQVVVLNQVRDLVVHQHTQIASSSSETTIVTAGAAGVFHDLTHLIVTNQTATAVNVTIKDATAGTTRMIIALAANGGAVIPFSVPVPQASAANNWTATLSSASVTVNIFAQAVKNV